MVRFSSVISNPKQRLMILLQRNPTFAFQLLFILLTVGDKPYLSIRDLPTSHRVRFGRKIGISHKSYWLLVLTHLNLASVHWESWVFFFSHILNTRVETYNGAHAEIFVTLLDIGSDNYFTVMRCDMTGAAFN